MKSTDGQRIKWCRNCLSRMHERDRRQTDGRAIAYSERERESSRVECRVRFKVQPNTITCIGHIRVGFLYGSNDPTDRVKAVKENGVLRIRLQSHQLHTTMLQKANTTHMPYKTDKRSK